MSKKLISGNSAVVQGALQAKATFFAGYPITPSSEIMEEWSLFADQSSSKKLHFVQAEDEITAIHMCIGAALTGQLAFTATSGPGFSLMQEGLGLAFVYEIPLVVINSQRRGPSTGMPTMPGQGDLLQTQYGTHGDYKSIVLAPNSSQECYLLTIQAFELAKKYKTPVIILLDAIISSLIELAEIKPVKPSILNSFIPLTNGDKKLFTGLVSDSNEPKTKDWDVYDKWINAKINKFNNVEIKDSYELYGNKSAKELLISYGCVSRALYEFIDKNSEKYALLRPKQIFPIPKSIGTVLKNYSKVTVLEMSDGQYCKALREKFLIDVKYISISDVTTIKIFES